MNKPLVWLFGIGIVFVAGPLLAAEDNWPQWRGPRSTGVAADGVYPVKFSGDEGLAWKVRLPGPGSSTPAVWGDSIFVTCTIGDEDGVVCYSFDGKEKWRATLGEARPGKHRNGSGSNPSPATDGEHLVVYYKSGCLACLDLAGNKQWQVNLQEKYGKDTLWWDLGTSPVLAGDKVIVAVMQSGDSYLAALDVEDGSEVWKVKRQYVRPEESDHAYTTPQVATIDGREVIVTWGADYLTGHDAATGEQLWEQGPFNPNEEANWRVIASHAMDDGIAIVPFGRGKYLAAVRATAGGAPPEVIWQQEGRGTPGADVPTPAIKDGRVYILTDQGGVACLDLATGAMQWRRDFPKDRDKFYASPTIAGDKIYCAREDGIVFVREIIEENGCDLLAENDMGERIIATPVAVRGGLLIRGEEHLFRVEGEAEGGAPAGR